MTLHSFGCSFVFGSDLDPSLPPWQHSEQTWPALVARASGLPYQCHAYPGIGNLHIAQSIFDCRFEPKDLAVISWTWIDRFDMRDYPQIWQTIRPDNPGPAARNYYRDLHSQYRDQLTNLMYVYSVQRFLESHGITYVMTYMDELLWQTQWHQEPAIVNLVSDCRPRVFDFQGMTFLDWSRAQNCRISENLHPLHEAHTLAARFVNDNWDHFEITGR